MSLSAKELPNAFKNKKTGKELAEWIVDNLKNGNIKATAQESYYIYYDLTVRDHCCDYHKRINVTYLNDPLWDEEFNCLYERGFKGDKTEKQIKKTISKIEDSQGWYESFNLSNFLYDIADNYLDPAIGTELRELLELDNDYIPEYFEYMDYEQPIISADLEIDEEINAVQHYYNSLCEAIGLDGEVVYINPTSDNLSLDFDFGSDYSHDHTFEAFYLHCKNIFKNPVDVRDDDKPEESVEELKEGLFNAIDDLRYAFERETSQFVVIDRVNGYHR